MVTRFAPSPTGYLHLGHVYSALMCQKAAGEKGRLLLRFEDIDHTRVRGQYYDAIIEDLEWLGVTFTEKPWRQKDRYAEYQLALEKLKKQEVVYPCFCTRKELALENPLSAPHGDDAFLYVGKCKALSDQKRESKIESGIPYSWRLDASKANLVAGALTFHDAIRGQLDVQPSLLGDVILARKDIQTSYHIAVVVDDAAQGVSHITRGEDLLGSTHIHRLLQKLLGYKEPQYFHHRLILDKDGKRLAKRDASLSIKTLREQDKTSEEIISMVLPLEL